MTVSPVNNSLTNEISAAKIFCSASLFSAAAILAAVGPWLLIWSFSGSSVLHFDVHTHAKSMMFGFVGALIAGYLVGKQRVRILVPLFGLWLAGRLAEVFSNDLILIHSLYSAYGLLLVILVAPKFRAAKKWRNLTMMPLITAIGCFPFVSWLLDISFIKINLSLHSLVLMISMLMFFMSGRFITPALTRAFTDRGLITPQRVQPFIEGTILVLLSMAVILSFSPSSSLWVSLSSGMAATLILVRLYRWKIFVLGWENADIWGLVTGYIWLGIGLLVFSLSLVTTLPIQSSMHIITVGALGTLSSTIILRLSLKRKLVKPLVYYFPIFLISLATLSRHAIGYIDGHDWWLLNFSALAWSLCFVVVFLQVLSNYRILQN